MSDLELPPAPLTRHPDLRGYAAIADVPVTLRAELDRRTIRVRDLLRLEVGSVLSLSRPAGENIDLYVGRVLVGSGEILVVDGMLSMRVADLRDKAPEGAHEPSPEEEQG